MARQLRISFSLSAISALLLLLASCAATSVVQPPFGQMTGTPPLIGFYHKVESGDTLSGLSRRFNIPTDNIRKANKLSDTNLIEPGQLLYVPLEKRSALLDSYSGKSGIASPPSGARNDVIARSAEGAMKQSPANHFIWPLLGNVITRFGVKKDDMVSKGIDIAAESGSLVRAAGDGVVTFAEDELSGIGKVIVIDHDSGFQTVYAHNEKNLVKVGETVSRSDIIAHVGSSGRALEPFLHFEIRKDHRPVDPLEYLQ